MLDKRPHILKYAVISSPVQDANGDWLPGETEALNEVLCRAEANGSGKYVASEDGANIVYSWQLFADLGTERIPFGTSVDIFKGEEKFATGTVKLFVEDQKKCRIWL